MEILSTTNSSIFFSSKSRTYAMQHCFSADRCTKRNVQRIALTCAIRRTSGENLYRKLGLESPQQRRWYWKLCCFYKISKNQASPYLFNLIPTPDQINRTRNADVVPHFNVRHEFFKNLFFFHRY